MGRTVGKWCAPSRTVPSRSSGLARVVVARKLIQECAESGFNRCDLGPQVWFPLDKLHDFVLAECGYPIVSGTSEQSDHRSCEPIAVATLVDGRQQHGHKLPENP